MASRSGHTLRANASVTMATCGAVRVSVCEKSRPRTSRNLRVSKKPGSTTFQSALMASSASGRPGRRTLPSPMRSAVERQIDRGRRRFDARQRRHALQQVADERASGIVLVPGDGEVQRQDVDAFLIETWLEARGMLQRAEEQPGGDDEQERHRDLSDDEHVAQPELRRTGVHAFGLERREQVCAGGLECRREARHSFAYESLRIYERRDMSVRGSGFTVRRSGSWFAVLGSRSLSGSRFGFVVRGS